MNTERNNLTNQEPAVGNAQPHPEDEQKNIAQMIAETRSHFDNCMLRVAGSDFVINYCIDEVFLKVGFLNPDRTTSFTAVVWYDQKPLRESKDLVDEITFFYPGDPEGRGFETIQRYDWLTFIKMAIRQGRKPEDLVALILPEDRSSEKLIRLRLEASLGTRCKESMAFDYAYWVFTGKRWSWIFTEGEFLDLKV